MVLYWKVWHSWMNMSIILKHFVRWFLVLRSETSCLYVMNICRRAAHFWWQRQILEPEATAAFYFFVAASTLRCKRGCVELSLTRSSFLEGHKQICCQELSWGRLLQSPLIFTISPEDLLCLEHEWCAHTGIPLAKSSTKTITFFRGLLVSLAPCFFFFFLSPVVTDISLQRGQLCGELWFVGNDKAISSLDRVWGLEA